MLSICHYIMIIYHYIIIIKHNQDHISYTYPYLSHIFPVSSRSSLKGRQTHSVRRWALGLHPETSINQAPQRCAQHAELRAAGVWLLCLGTTHEATEGEENFN